MQSERSMLRCFFYLQQAASRTHDLSFYYVIQEEAPGVMDEAGIEEKPAVLVFRCA